MKRIVLYIIGIGLVQSFSTADFWTTEPGCDDAGINKYTFRIEDGKKECFWWQVRTRPDSVGLSEIYDSKTT